MMSHDVAIAFSIFTIAAFYTPGPNNIMLLASGLNYGFRRTLPHIAGITIGFSVLLLTVGIGLGAVFTTYPVLQTILKYVGAVYLIYLAFVIGLSKPSFSEKAATGRPMTFIGAALFQWVNVKGLITAISMVTVYAAIAPYPWNMIVLALLSAVIGLTSTVTCTWFGSALQPVISSPARIRVFNVIMAILLVASLYPVLWG